MSPVAVLKVRPPWRIPLIPTSREFWYWPRAGRRVVGGVWVLASRGSEQGGRRRSGFGTPKERILLFASKPRSVFVRPRRSIRNR